MITPPSPLEKIRSPFGAIFSESGSICGTVSILPVTVLTPVEAAVRIGCVMSAPRPQRLFAADEFDQRSARCWGSRPSTDWCSSGKPCCLRTRRRRSRASPTHWRMERAGDGVGLRIDQRQRRIAVLILQRPNLAGVGIELQAVDRAGDLVGELNVARLVVLDDRARSGRSGRIRPVAIFHEDRTVAGRDRIQARSDRSA